MLRPSPGIEFSQLRKALFELEQELERYKNLYNDLLFYVGTKYPGETRHETAKRYIQEKEKGVQGEGSDGPYAPLPVSPELNSDLTSKKKKN